MPTSTDLTDAEMNTKIASRIAPWIATLADHRLNLVDLGDRLDAAIAADTAKRTDATVAELREVQALIASEEANVVVYVQKINAMDKIGNAPNSPQRVKNQANQAITKAKAVVLPEVPTPTA